MRFSHCTWMPFASPAINQLHDGRERPFRHKRPGALFRLTDLFTKDSAAFRISLPDPKDFVSYSHLGVTQFFLHTSAEDTGVEQLMGMHSRLPKTPVVGFVVSPLRYFPNHKLAIVITAKVA